MSWKDVNRVSAFFNALERNGFSNTNRHFITLNYFQHINSHSASHLPIGARSSVVVLDLRLGDRPAAVPTDSFRSFLCLQLIPYRHLWLQPLSCSFTHWLSTFCVQGIGSKDEGRWPRSRPLKVLSLLIAGVLMNSWTQASRWAFPPRHQPVRN